MLLSVTQDAQPGCVVHAGLWAGKRQLYAWLVDLPADGIPDALQSAALAKLLDTLRILANWVPGLLPANDPLWRLLKVGRGLLIHTDAVTRHKLLTFCFSQIEDEDLAGHVLSVVGQHQERGNPDSRSESVGSSVVETALAFILGTDLSLPLAWARGPSVCRDLAVTLQYFPGSLSTASAEAAIANCWGNRVEALAACLADSSWTLAAWCSNGGVRICHQLAALAEFDSNPALARYCRKLSALLVHAHLQSGPDPHGKRQLLKLICSLAQPGMVQPTALPWLANPGCLSDKLQADELLYSALQQEVSCYRESLDLFLDARTDGRDTEKYHRQQLLQLTTRMRWVLLEAGLECASTCLACCSEVMARYWFCKIPWPDRITVLLATLREYLLVDILLHTDADRWESLQTQMLSLWPQQSYGADIPVRIGPATPTTLGQVPRLLSSSLQTLAMAEPQGFYMTDADSQGAEQMLHELALLERGAAAVEIRPVERLCGQLLDMYGLLQVSDTTIPTALLQRAHSSLLSMLDAAALWQEPVQETGLSQEIDAWLRERWQQYPLAEHPVDWPGLCLALQSFAASLGGMLALPLRLEIQTLSAPPQALPGQVLLHIVQVLIRTLCLDVGSHQANRNGRHLPVVTVFTLSVALVDGHWCLELGEDSGAAVPDTQEMSRLKLKLPDAASRISCRMEHGLRVFRVTFRQ
jgi:hypothetical protein